MTVMHPDPDRRLQLQRWAGLMAAAAALSVGVSGRAGARAGASRRLVAFYSRTGHTRQAARVIAEAVGADRFEVLPATPYPAGYQASVELNVRQREAGHHPGVAALVPELDRYVTVFLGYPIWAVDLPRLLVPFLAQQNFVGKALVPFCTSAMSGLANTGQTLARLCPRARVLRGLALPGGARGHNTLVTRIDADAGQQADQWARRALDEGTRR